MGQTKLMTWSNKINLREYIKAPKTAGVYILGIPNGYFMQPGEKEDTFLGENFPEDFEPMYVGISKRSIRSRLYSHYKGRGNKNVKNHLNGLAIIDVFFIYYESSETEVEDTFLIALENGFQWNTKKRENGNWVKYMLERY